MIKEVQNISIEDYNYPLPDERIAKYPLGERDASKLLVLKNGELTSSHFKNINDFLKLKKLATIMDKCMQMLMQLIPKAVITIE